MTECAGVTFWSTRYFVPLEVGDLGKAASWHDDCRLGRAVLVESAAPQAVRPCGVEVWPLGAAHKGTIRPSIRLQVENAILRHQLIVLQRKIRSRVHFTNSDRLFCIRLYRRFPSMLDVLRISVPNRSPGAAYYAEGGNGSKALGACDVTFLTEIPYWRTARTGLPPPLRAMQCPCSRCGVYQPRPAKRGTATSVCTFLAQCFADVSGYGSGQTKAGE
jgi:hypothetical protein